MLCVVAVRFIAWFDTQLNYYIFIFPHYNFFFLTKQIKKHHHSVDFPLFSFPRKCIIRKYTQRKRDRVRREREREREREWRREPLNQIGILTRKL